MDRFLTGHPELAMWNSGPGVAHSIRSWQRRSRQQRGAGGGEGGGEEEEEGGEGVAPLLETLGRWGKTKVRVSFKIKGDLRLKTNIEPHN